MSTVVPTTPDPHSSDKGDENQHKKPELTKRHTLTVVLSKKSLNTSSGKREERKQVAVKTVADSLNPKKSIETKFGVYSVQGRRETMEDNHLAIPNYHDQPGEELKTEPKKEDPKSEPKKEDPKSEPKKEDPKSEPKKDDPKTEPKKDDPKTETKKEDPKTEPKKDDTKTETKKEDPKNNLEIPDKTNHRLSRDKSPKRDKKETKITQTNNKKHNEKKEKKHKKSTKEKKEKQLSSRPVTEVIDSETSPITSFFAVYDGHGGRQASDYAAARLHKYVLNYAQTEASIETAIKKAYKQLEDEFMEIAVQKQLSDGTTAVIAVLDQHNKLTVANVGDSEAILCRGSKAIPLSTPHNPHKSQAEKERVLSVGGKIWNNRVGHPALNAKFFSIAVSRSIGDMMYKNPEITQNKQSGLIADPEINQVFLTDDDNFLILACDGLFDVITEQEAVDFVYEHMKTTDDLEAIAKRLVEAAMIKGSLDNITALLVAFIK